MYLFDVNILIAALMKTHTFHRVYRDWQEAEDNPNWCSCPLTENACLRILGNPRLPGSFTSPSHVREALQHWQQTSSHRFLPDDLSLLDAGSFPSLPTSKQLTDFYLLALAVKHRVRFLTFDQRIDPKLVPGGEKAYVVLG